MKQHDRLRNRIRFGLAVLTAAFLAYSIHAEARPVVINAVGDIMLAGSARPLLKARGYDYPFDAVRDELSRADLSVGNLEAPLSRRGTEYADKRFRFRSDPAGADALRRAGIRVVTLANNHMMDFGPVALQDTLEHLDRAGIAHAGAGADLAAARREAMVDVDGKRIAFLAYSITLPEEFYATSISPGTAPGFPRYFRSDVARCRREADHVIVSFHWGSEGATAPHPYQVAAARAAIDAGADLVIGHHPHVLQGIEYYGKGVILYSLGNFAFGTTSRQADRSVIARVTLDDGVAGVELVPLNILNREVRFQPQLLGGEGGETAMKSLNLLCADFGTAIVRDGSRYRAVRASDMSLAHR